MPLYPEITPHHTAMLPVTGGHTLYIEESGNPAGIPVVVLHGGPGGGVKPNHRQRFNPQKYRIICFDQRGAGRSTPAGGLQANTTPNLVEDIELIREYFKVESWLVYGFSWGSTLALAYAQSYPERVKSLFIGGIFLGTEHELNWMSQPTGVARFFPNEYGAVKELLGNPAPEDILSTLYLALSGGNAEFAERVAQTWASFEGLCLDVVPNKKDVAAYLASMPDVVAHGALQFHYFSNQCFLQPDELLNNTSRITHIPTYILQGALDMVCPPEMAYRLHAALPGSKLEIVPLCGHRANPEMEDLRVLMLDALATQLG